MIRVLVLGYGPMGLALARGVQSRNDIATLVGVFPWSKLPAQEHMRHEDSEYEFLRFIDHHQIPVVTASSVNDFSFARILEELKPDMVLIGSWGEILKAHTLETPGVRFINCHPSLLPHHRGPNPYISVILSGESETGVTFHQMDTGIDTGPIVHQTRIALDENDTGDTLRQKCCRVAEESTGELLELLAANALAPQKQVGEGSYYKSLPDLEQINWSDSPTELDRQLRAIYPWAFVKTFWMGRPVLFEYGRVFHNRPQFNSAPEPGRVVHKTWRGVWVETREPGTLIWLCNAFFPDVPLWLTPIYRWTRFKSGQCFSALPTRRQV